MQRFLRICMWVTLATPGLAAAVTAPTITSHDIDYNASGTLITLTVATNQDATAYYVASTADIAPTAAEIRNGQLSDGNLSPRRGSFSTFSSSPGSTVITGFRSGTGYYIFLIVENSSGEQSTILRISAIGADLTRPVYSQSSIVNITDTQFDLRVSVNKPGTVHYVVSTSAVAPFATQIANGNDYTGNPAFISGVFSIAAYTPTAKSITGLNSGTGYYVYSVAEDTDGNLSDVNVLSTTTGGSPACTPGNVTAATLRDGFGASILAWTNPVCFDEILIVSKRDNPVTFVPSGDGTAYAAGTEVLPGQYVHYRGIANTATIGTGIYVYQYFTVFTRKGTTWSSGTSLSAYMGPPETVSLSPANGSTNIATNQVFTITFTEPVFLSTTNPTNPGIIFYGPALTGADRMINRNGIGGDGTISISGNVATITWDNELAIASRYAVSIFPGMFVDQYGNDYGGSNPKGFWLFNTVTTATAVNAPTAAVCPNQYSALGDIVLTEVADNNFQGTDNGTLTLALEFNKTGFSFSPGTTGITATAAADGDIESVTVTSVSATQALFAVKFKDVANNAAARDNHDAITISGLKVTRTDASVTPATVVSGTTGTLRVQGVTPGTTVLANITAGTIPTAVPTVAWPDDKSIYCQNTDLSGIAITASGGTSYNWYSDAALTTLIAGGTSSQTGAQLFGTSPEAGVATRYVTNVAGCQSAATEVTLTILAAPPADAGAAQAVCPLVSVTLGGEPVAGAINYSYVWTGPDGFSSTSANPYISVPANTTDANISQVYTLSVTDENQCTASDEVTITVNEVSQPVSITAPNIFTYNADGAAVTLQGSPAGGTFSGKGVVLSAGTYQFDPAIATVGLWPVKYTTILSNGCIKSEVQNFTVTVVTANEPSVATRVELYPNPVNELLSIEVPENTPGAVTLRMIDSFGRETVVTEVERGQRYASIDTHTFATGVYIVRIETSGSVVYRRVVIAHD